MNYRYKLLIALIPFGLFLMLISRGIAKTITATCYSCELNEIRLNGSYFINESCILNYTNTIFRVQLYTIFDTSHEADMFIDTSKYGKIECYSVLPIYNGTIFYNHEVVDRNVVYGIIGATSIFVLGLIYGLSKCYFFL